jgi:hypothetical protein
MSKRKQITTPDGRSYPLGVAQDVKKIVYEATADPQIRSQVLIAIAAAAACDSLGFPVVPAMVKRMALSITNAVNYEADLIREENNQ